MGNECFKGRAKFSRGPKSPCEYPSQCACVNSPPHSQRAYPTCTHPNLPGAHGEAVPAGAAAPSIHVAINLRTSVATSEHAQGNADGAVTGPWSYRTASTRLDIEHAIDQAFGWAARISLLSVRVAADDEQTAKANMADVSGHSHGHEDGQASHIGFGDVSAFGPFYLRSNPKRPW